jgi:hypothetical protein
VVTKPLSYRALGDVVIHPVSVSIRAHPDDWHYRRLLGDREALVCSKWLTRRLRWQRRLHHLLLHRLERSRYDDVVHCRVPAAAIEIRRTRSRRVTLRIWLRPFTTISSIGAIWPSRRCYRPRAMSPVPCPSPPALPTLSLQQQLKVFRTITALIVGQSSARGEVTAVSRVRHEDRHATNTKDSAVLLPPWRAARRNCCLAK